MHTFYLILKEPIHLDLTLALKGYSLFPNKENALEIFSKNWPLGRFFHRVAMSVAVYVYMSPPLESGREHGVSQEYRFI